ncbi:DUF2321 domain-containing protein [Neobacillus pocheonensis]|uniref:DUF2321 domain-containing protein n=1 Tax=Neobacillus pocheonensis TaxID=363869 RepID=UPI003D278AD5
MSYQTAQICLNGHVINGNFEGYPIDNQNYCQECGSKTIHECPDCKSNIRGDLDYGVGYEHLQFAPKHCYNCGSPYPWIKEKLKAAKELADEIEELSEEEREKLKGTIDDLLIEGPRTELAAIRFKKLLPKAKVEIANGLKNIIVDIASEYAKKLLIGS